MSKSRPREFIRSRGKSAVYERSSNSFGFKEKKRFFHWKTLELLKFIENKNLFLKSESQASERRGNRASRVTLLIPWRRLMIFVRKIEIKPNAIQQNCAVGQVKLNFLKLSKVNHNYFFWIFFLYISTLYYTFHSHVVGRASWIALPDIKNVNLESSPPILIPRLSGSDIANCAS